LRLRRIRPRVVTDNKWLRCIGSLCLQRCRSDDDEDHQRECREVASHDDECLHVQNPDVRPIRMPTEPASSAPTGKANSTTAYPGALQLTSLSPRHAFVSH